MLKEDKLELERELENKNKIIHEKDLSIEFRKTEYYKLQEDFKRKCETFDTLKAVAKEIQKKNDELEKEVWMGKGASKDNDLIGAEINMD